MRLSGWLLELADPFGALEVGKHRTWSNLARGAGPSASKRFSSWRSSSSKRIPVSDFAAPARRRKPAGYAPS